MELVAPAYKVELKLSGIALQKVWEDFRRDELESDGHDGAATFFREEVVMRMVRQYRRAIHPIHGRESGAARYLQSQLHTLSNIRGIKREFGKGDGLVTFTFELYAPLAHSFGRRDEHTQTPHAWVLAKIIEPMLAAVEHWSVQKREFEDAYEKWRQTVYQEMARDLRELTRGVGFAQLKVEHK